MMTDWPFAEDADRDDPLTRLRIPVTGVHPRWRYVACFDRESEDRPTDAEAAMLASFIREYIEHWFNQGYQRRLAERALDVDSGCNTVIFHKWGPDDWSYRLDSWQYGPFWVPVAPRLRGGQHDYRGPWKLSLVDVMDHKHTIGDEPLPRSAQWKAAHPDVFPVAHADAPSCTTGDTPGEDR
ncbi:hypothetical protein [Streptomyces halobius]|uniref:Uncharacterized protein n=1 Tax=Streptomyces halobius TaxID=2879846 RepID=A0ABY4M0D9_9ACTN|nr:hypothetical protein [Streptomyces halobius]UQA91212.1 hypothetical protein K9S39_04380 [Streptomyces halobius]